MTVGGFLQPGSMPAADAVIVMMDTRPALPPHDVSAARLQYPQLAFELNRRYACIHGVPQGC